MNLLRSYSYSRVAKEDPDERKHRRAQFLIYKQLQKADMIKIRKQSLLPMRLSMFKLRIKVGVRLIKRAKKTVCFTISQARAKVCAHKKVLEQLRLCRPAANLLQN